MKNRKFAFGIVALTSLALVLFLAPAFIPAQTSADQDPASFPQKARGAAAEAREDTSPVAKSYSLKYVDASAAYQAVQLLIYKGQIAGNVLNVVIPKNKVQDLEELLKKIDVEKKSILFRIFAVLASRKAPNDESLKALHMAASIDDPDLKRVLDELKGLWNFKSYLVDSPSFLNVKDGSGPNSLRLVSEWPQFKLTILHPQIKGEESGKRIISIGQIQLNDIADSTIIDTKDVTLKEKGYLVVGVGGMAMVGAVILIISAEIK